MPHGNIFISYRRGADSNAAGRLYDRLERTFPPENLFFDIDSIPLGVDFAAIIDAEVAKCDAQLVVIGQGWLEAVPRLQNPDDFVRIEIEAALKRAGTPVVPLLFDGASMPTREQLPESLHPLLRRNAILVPHAQFAQIVDGRLTQELKRAIATAAAVRGDDMGPETAAEHPADTRALPDLEPGPTAPEPAQRTAGDAPPQRSEARDAGTANATSQAPARPQVKRIGAALGALGAMAVIGALVFLQEPTSPPVPGVQPVDQTVEAPSEEPIIVLPPDATDALIDPVFVPPLEATKGKGDPDFGGLNGAVVIDTGPLTDADWTAFNTLYEQVLSTRRIDDAYREALIVLLKDASHYANDDPLEFRSLIEELRNELTAEGLIAPTR